MTTSADPAPEPGTDGLDDLGYAEAVAELDGILADLDRDTIDVDDLARQVRRAAVLIRHCRGRIADARLEVERVVVELGELADVPAGDEAGPDGDEADPDSDEPDSDEAGNEDTLDLDLDT
jgi:exodeoxyribonuclease VII small subunit